MHKMDPTESMPFVAEALKMLRDEVGPETAVLGFVGCPYTLATYLVEGKTSKEYLEIKKMALNEPKLLHAILQQLADNSPQVRQAAQLQKISNQRITPQHPVQRQRQAEGHHRHRWGRRDASQQNETVR